MVRWLEADGYDVSYSTGVDTDRSGPLITQHKVFMSVGHDKYWSGAQRANVEAARAAGVNLAFFSGNEVFWKTGWENVNSGHWSASRNYFASSGVDNAPLHAPANGSGGVPDGRYAYGNSSSFPTRTNSANYGVDVVFNTSPH